MKLLQINVTSNWGSAGKIAECIGQEAMKRGWDSYIAYGRSCNPSKSNTIKIGCKIDNYTHYFFNRIFDMEGLCSVIATRKLIRKVKQISPDAILLHNIHDHYLNYKLLFEYLNSTSIPVLWTFHDCWAMTGHCYHFMVSNCEKWQNHCINCPQRYRFRDRSEKNFSLKKELFSNNKNLIIIPCSDWMGSLVKQSFFKDKPIITIHNGVNIDVFKPHKNNEIKKENFKILAVSNVWLPYKGINDILKLRTILPKEYEITIVGLSERQIKSLPEGIIGIKRTQKLQELVDLYSNADVFINPTYIDNFPTVNLEALACGTPVITYKTGGSPEAIDQKTGIVIERGNINAFANALVQMKQNPLSSEDCRKRAEELFDSKKCFKTYVDMFVGLTEKK